MSGSLLLFDPALEHVVQMAGADDLVWTGVELGGVEEEGVALRAAKAAVIADQFLEGRHFAG